MEAIFWPSAMRARRRASTVSASASAGMGTDKSCIAACRASWAFSEADDQHFSDSAAAAVSSRERVVEDYHIGGVGVKRCRVGVDKHRVGGADRLQIHSKLAGDVKLVEEDNEAALGVVRACVGRGLVGATSLAEQIGEAACRAGVVDALQRVGSNAVGRSRLAALAGEEKGSRPEQVSGRRCTWPHGGR